MRYAVKRIEEIPGVPDPDPGDPDWKPLRHHFGLGAFGVNVFIQAEAGGRLVDDQPRDGHRAPGALRRSAIAVEPATAVLVIGGTPGRPYEVSTWDSKWTSGLRQA